VHIKLSESTKAKGVACEIKGKTLKAGLKGQEPVLQVSKSDALLWNTLGIHSCAVECCSCAESHHVNSLVQGEFYTPVKSDVCFWSLGKQFDITLTTLVIDQ
jgi:hypothetical protein